MTNTRLSALLFLLVSAAPAVADDFALLQGMGDTRYHQLDSKLVEQGYHLFVRLPADYAERSGDLPTVYLLDGGWTFPLFAAYYQYLNLAEEIPDALIVGISYGTDDFRLGNGRSRDYTAPSDERAHWGGAGDFQSVLREEILPLVESEYRSDAGRRVIFGQSIGGQFVLYTALTRPDLFWGHIASNPALHRNLPFFLENHSDENESREDTRLFVGAASGDEERFRVPREEWTRHWSSRGSLPWRLEVRTLEGHSHLSAPPAAFREGMRWLFETE